jgi:hypothetical protein
VNWFQGQERLFRLAQLEAVFNPQIEQLLEVNQGETRRLSWLRASRVASLVKPPADM